MREVRRLGNGLFIDDYGQVQREHPPEPQAAPPAQVPQAGGRRRGGRLILPLAFLVRGLISVAVFLLVCALLVEGCDRLGSFVDQAPSAHALPTVAVRRSHLGRFCFCVNDFVANDDFSRAFVTIAIRTQGGGHVHTFALGWRTTDATQAVRLRCRFRRGVYLYYVYARYPTGQVVMNPDAGRLVVH